jgi:hypothetical protein
MGDLRELYDSIVYDLRRWVELRVDSAKLAVLEGIASVAGSAMGLIIFLFLLNLALTVFTGVFIYLVHLLVHSWVWAAVIVGFAYLIAGLIFLLRPGIFRNMMVRILAPKFFANSNINEEDDDCECDR